MSGSTVGLQWVYSGSTVGLQWLYNEQKTNNERCESHGQIMKRRTMNEQKTNKRRRNA